MWPQDWRGKAAASVQVQLQRPKNGVMVELCGPLEGTGIVGLSGARRGAEQTAASRENAREASNRDKKEDRSAKDWLDDLNPEQKRMLGEMLKEFL
mgnify:CR=1 FL=1